MPITTKVVGSNPVHGEEYLIQHYMIKFVSDSPQVSVYFSGIPVSSTNKTDHHDINEKLLKVAFNTINLNPMNDSCSLMEKSSLRIFCKCGEP